VPKPSVDNQYRVSGLTAEQLESIVKGIRSAGGDIEIERDARSGHPALQEPHMLGGKGPEFTVIVENAGLLKELSRRSGVTIMNCVGPKKK
jgi:hypothetical protein